MARLSTRSAKSAQKSTIRYIATTDIERTARDFGVSENTLRRFVNAKPEALAKSRNKSYRKILSTDVRAVAKSEKVRLVPRLTREKTLLAKQESAPSERTVRSIRYSESIMERIPKRDKETGKLHYRPANPERVKAARNQIIHDMTRWNTKSIVASYNNGMLTRREAINLMRDVYKNSGAPASAADAAFAKATGE